MNCLEKIKYYQFYLSLDNKYKYILSKNFDKINWEEAATDEYAISLMEKYFNEYNWGNIASYTKGEFPFFSYNSTSYDSEIDEFMETRLNNPKSILFFLEKHPRFIDWSALSFNPNAIHILEKNLDKVNWHNLAGNTGAVDIIENNLDKVKRYWIYVCLNPGAIKLLEKNMDKIEWRAFSRNPGGLHIFEDNLDKINWHSFDTNPKAIIFMENMINKGKAKMIFDNDEAAFFLKENKNRINWDKLTISKQEKKNIRYALD